jgi:hypothetical protein
VEGFMAFRQLLAVVLLSMFAGCAIAPPGAIVLDSPAAMPSIQGSESARLEKISIGMTVPEFKSVFPEAYVGGQSGQTTAYEFVRIQKYVTQGDIDRQNFWWGAGSPDAREYRQSLWFYFYGGRLVKWGRPQDWPEPNELIIREKGAQTEPRPQPPPAGAGQKL